MSKNGKANNIRLISGRWRGTRLPVVDSDGLRPTTDRVRETVFNWLMHGISGARCLDLFAGSGAMGFESLSRAAAFVQFVESEKKVSAELRKNLQRLSVPGSEGSLYERAAHRFLRNEAVTPFDIVFLDPPFQANLLMPTTQMLEDLGWLAESALIYVEHAASDDSFTAPRNWVLHKQSKAGQSQYALYSRE